VRARKRKIVTQSTTEENRVSQRNRIPAFKNFLCVSPGIL
jgi:hypothetical protein